MVYRTYGVDEVPFVVTPDTLAVLAELDTEMLHGSLFSNSFDLGVILSMISPSSQDAFCLEKPVYFIHLGRYSFGLKSRNDHNLEFSEAL